MADPDGMGRANTLMTVFSNTVSNGFDKLQGPIDGVFGVMIVLVVALTGIKWALSPDRELLAGAFGKVLLIGFFAWLINDWQGLTDTLQQGFIDLGLTAGGGTLTHDNFLNPGAILEQGWNIVAALGRTPAPAKNPVDVFANMVDALIFAVAMIGIMLAFAVLALQIIVTLLEFKIVTLGGFVLLPFGIWSKSAFLAERPLGFVVSSGLKLLTLAIVVSGACTVFNQLQPPAAPGIYDALAILSASLLLAMLAMFIPSLASALVTGGPTLGAGAALTAGLAVGGGAALAAAGATGLGAAASRIAGSSRAAAGAGSGRPPTPPSSPPSSPPGGPRPGGPRPSNDNPSPSGPRPAAGRGGPPGGAAPGSGVGDPGRIWAGPGPGTGAGAGSPAAAHEGAASAAGSAGHGSSAGQGSSAHPGTRPGAGAGPSSRPGARSAGKIGEETEAARQAFHRAAGDGGRSGAPRQRRSAALQSFFVANAGRGLMPSGETSGSISPHLKTEEP